MEVPLTMRLLQRFPALRRIPTRLVGVGIRPEHVRLRPLPKTLIRSENQELALIHWRRAAATQRREDLHRY